MNTQSWRLSIPQMTIMVRIDRNQRIIEAAPIVHKFVGEFLTDLIRWMQRVGGNVDVMFLGE